MCWQQGRLYVGFCMESCHHDRCLVNFHRSMLHSPMMLTGRCGWRDAPVTGMNRQRFDESASADGGRFQPQCRLVRGVCSGSAAPVLKAGLTAFAQGLVLCPLSPFQPSNRPLHQSTPDSPAHLNIPFRWRPSWILHCATTRRSPAPKGPSNKIAGNKSPPIPTSIPHQRE